MLTRVAGRLMLLVLGVGTVTAMASHPTRRMFPQYVLFRQPGVPNARVLYHAPAKMITVNGRSGVDMSDDPIFLVYQGLRAATQISPDQLKGAAFIEVAEFYGPHAVSPDGRPMGDPKFESADHFSRIYIGTASHGPVWESPVVAPGGANERYYQLSDSGQRVLNNLGLHLREVMVGARQ